MDPDTIAQNAGCYSVTCGYCSNGTNRKCGARPRQIPCETYQTLLDKGWWRSGGLLYKYKMRDSCCSPYTIKLDVQDFAPNEQMRRIVNQWNNYIRNGNKSPEQAGSLSPRAGDFDLLSAIHASEILFCPNEQFAHIFEVALEPSAYSDEKFELYCKYQTGVHYDDYGLSPDVFKGFLVDSPLRKDTIKYEPSSEAPPHLPETYGTYHMTYRVDGELVAFSVVDILPTCVGSVYFVYRPDLRESGMGKLSIMREAVLAKEMHDAGAGSMESLRLGYYVHSCPKSKYKGDFAPSCLLDPESLEWHPLSKWRHLLRTHHYASIDQPKVNIRRS